MSKPELLAPAGDWKSFIAAVEAGADAVYFGGKDFSARSFAVNLSREEIQKAIDYAHLRGVKCYAAVNTLVKDSEFAKLFDFINFLYIEGIDALIIQDLGVLYFCRKYFPDLPLHASTQMSAHNLRDVLKLEKMGFKRAVLARELNLEEIQEIKNKSKIEIECFVHGALCFSYSGQCYMSSMIGGRSGNRGKCAQPCRKKYALVDGKTGESKDTEGYLLSTKDLCALDILDKMQFIDSLKIEGRMKGSVYVGGVVEKYRKAIDGAARNKKILPEELDADKKELAGIFNRGGFSHGYLLEKKPKDLISPERSKNFGVPAGEVIESKNGAVKIRTIDVGVNDGLEIWGRLGQEKNVGFRVEKMTGDIINIIIAGDIRVGDKVYKNYDYKLNKKLEVLAEENYRKKTSVKMIFRAKEGENITLEIYPCLFEGRRADGLENSVILNVDFLKIDKTQKVGVNGARVEGAKAETAIKIATSEDVAREQLGKLGSTPFVAEKIDVEIIGNVYISLKNLNNLRRDCALKLEKEIINSFKRERKAERFEISNSLLRYEEYVGKNNLRRIAVQSDDPAALDALVQKKISRVYTSLKVDIEKFHKNNIEVYQALPRILRKGEKTEIFAEYDGFLVSAPGYLDLLPPKAKKIGDFSLNIFNSYSAQELKNLGFSGFTASLENTLDEINSLDREKMEKEAVVYGLLTLMTSERCVLYKTKLCKQQNIGTCPVANRSKESILNNKIEAKPFLCENYIKQKLSNRISVGVKDEMGKVFPLTFDCANCRMQILNSVPLYFTEVEKLEADNIRIIHTIENPEKIIKIVENYISGNFGSVENTTTGHFNRGVE